MRLVRSLSFFVAVDDPRLEWLLKEFRLVVNRSVRIANAQAIGSLTRLTRVAYAELGREHAILRQYICTAFRTSLGLLRAHRRRLRKGRQSSVPYVRRLLLKAGNQSYVLDRATGHLRLPIRAREYVEIDLPLSAWHRKFIGDPEWRLGSLTVVPGRVIIAVTKETPPVYEPSAAIALDTNEDSLDGVFVSDGPSELVTISLLGLRHIQAIHFRRRRAIARKKAHDRRVMRNLLRREGTRERNRVCQRIHRVSKRLVQLAAQEHAAIVVENLSLPGAGGRCRRLNRRLSSWPRREIHRQIEYKAALDGVPILKVNPKNTSKTCPVCGEVKGRRDRVGGVFSCAKCGWTMNRQHTAGLNILKTALASNEALARAVWFQPDALRDDVVISLCDLPGFLGAHGRSRAEWSRESRPK